MSPKKYLLIEEMDADELREELRQVYVYNIALQNQREKSSGTLRTLVKKWEEGSLDENDWIPLMALVY